MNDLFEYIECYFEQALSDPENRVFETRCIYDKEFAKEVAFYIMIRKAIHKRLMETSVTGLKRNILLN
jgi:hypothetical protein